MAETPLWLQPRSARYFRLEGIGSGSYGVITLAIDQLTNKRVALKKQDATTKECSAEFAFSAHSAHTQSQRLPHVGLLR